MTPKIIKAPKTFNHSKVAVPGGDHAKLLYILSFLNKKVHLIIHKRLDGLETQNLFDVFADLVYYQHKGNNVNLWFYKILTHSVLICFLKCMLRNTVSNSILNPFGNLFLIVFRKSPKCLVNLCVTLNLSSCRTRKT